MNPPPHSAISVVVPVWNGRELLGRLLRSLAAQTRPAAEWIVVDNGSNDGAPELALEMGARIVTMGRNAGFAPAVNRGIRESTGEWIAVLNNDVELAPDYLEILSSSNAWFATGKILNYDGAIDGTFDAVVRGGTAWRFGSGCPDGPLFSSRRSIWSAPWTAALFRAGLFEKVGMLEERFESYLEDVEFGLRCARSGLAGEYIPDAVARHRGSATLGRWHADTVRRISRNQVFLLARHYPTSLLLRWGWKIVAAHCIWGLLAVRHGRGFAWSCGKVEGLVRWVALRTGYLPSDPGVLEQILTANEKAIWDVQSVTGFDSYWKLYFLLTRSGSK